MQPASSKPSHRIACNNPAVTCPDAQSVRRGLTKATAWAAALGVRDVPAVAVGERVFHGEGALEEAAGHALTMEPLAR